MQPNVHFIFCNCIKGEGLCLAYCDSARFFLERRLEKQVQQKEGGVAGDGRALFKPSYPSVWRNVYQAFPCYPLAMKCFYVEPNAHLSGPKLGNVIVCMSFTLTIALYRAGKVMGNS